MPHSHAHDPYDEDTEPQRINYPREYPRYVPRRAPFPERLGFFQNLTRSCLLLVVIGLVLVVLPWILVFFFAFNRTAEAPRVVEETSRFWGEIHPIIKEWLPTWTIGILAAFAIGIAIRVCRRI